MVEVVMEMEGEEEELNQDWRWEEEPSMWNVNVEEEEGMEMLGPGTGAFALEVENDEMVQVKQENYLEEDMMDFLGDDLEDTAVDIENDGVPHINCLLCYKAVSKEESALGRGLRNDLNEQNFNSVFILRKMLNVPKERLVGYLEDFRCPGKWVEFCKNCLGLVDQALRIQKEINEMEDRLRKCQEKMVHKIKSTCNKKVEETSNEISRITQESRQFVVSATTGNKKNGKRVGSSRPSDDPEERIMKPSSAKAAKLLPEYDETVELVENTAIKFVKILNEGMYSCSHCPTINKNMSLVPFYSHLIFHAKRPYKCSICYVHWSSAAELQKNPFAKEKPSNEHVCSEATLVKIPDGKINPGKIWSCKWCPEKKFEMEMERDSHEQEEHSSLKSPVEMEYKCLSCSTAYRSYQEWLLHRVLEHPEVAATSCLYCDYTSVIQTEEEKTDFLDTSKMRSHVITEHTSCASYFTSPETCDFCGEAFEFGKVKGIRTPHQGCSYARLVLVEKNQVIQ